MNEYILILKNIEEDKMIYTYNNHSDRLDPEVISIFEKMLKELTVDNNYINTKNELNYRENKLFTNEGNYYIALKKNLYVGVFSPEKNNEEIYMRLTKNVSEDENFIVWSDDKEKVRALLCVYLNKYFTNINQNSEKNILVINDNKGASTNKTFKKFSSLHVTEENEGGHETNFVIPQNHVRNQGLKMFLIIIFVIIGIGLAIILPFVI